MRERRERKNAEQRLDALIEKYTAMLDMQISDELRKTLTKCISDLKAAKEEPMRLFDLDLPNQVISKGFLGQLERLKEQAKNGGLMLDE